jgi:hypothetical protein
MKKIKIPTSFLPVLIAVSACIAVETTTTTTATSVSETTLDTIAPQLTVYTPTNGQTTNPYRGGYYYRQSARSLHGRRLDLELYDQPAVAGSNWSVTVSVSNDGPYTLQSQRVRLYRHVGYEVRFHHGKFHALSGSRKPARFGCARQCGYLISSNAFFFGFR